MNIFCNSDTSHLDCISAIVFSLGLFLEDAQDLRRQLKALEEKNMIYMQQNLDLEEVRLFGCYGNCICNHVILNDQ